MNRSRARNADKRQEGLGEYAVQGVIEEAIGGEDGKGEHREHADGPEQAGLVIHA